jgi:hypothetical protein
MELADIWFVPPRIPRNLKVGNYIEMGFNAFGQIAFHDLAVIEVHLQEEVVTSHRIDDPLGLRRGVEEIARHVTRIDGLDEEANTMWLEYAGSVAEITDVHGFTRLRRCPIRWNASHGVHLMALDVRA